MDVSNEQPAPQPVPPVARGSIWRRGALGVGLVVGGFALGAVTLASAGGMPWHGNHWGGHWGGPRIGMIQHVVHGALENVGATTAQEDKIHDILAATYTDLDRDKAGHEQFRKQVLDLMRAPTIDRAAVEKLRSDRVAAFDAKSKTIVNAVLDAAGQLTPEQRGKLVQQAEDRMEHHGWGGWRHRGDEHDGPAHDGDHGGGDHGPDDHGPDHG